MCRTLPSLAALVVALLTASCGAPQGGPSAAPTPAVEGAGGPDGYLARFRADLLRAGVDPDALRCDSRVVWASGLRADAEAFARELDGVYAPLLEGSADEEGRERAREAAERLAMNWMIRTVILHGGTQNLGGLVLARVRWTDDSGASRPLVVFHSATTSDAEEAGSCLRSLVEAGGVRHLVNLYDGGVPLADRVEAERALATELGATYADTAEAEPGYGSWREVASDPEAGPEERAEAMREVARLVREQVLRPGGEPLRGNVYFHCAGGMHRSTLIHGVLARCLGDASLDEVREVMQVHGDYQDGAHPGGFEEPLVAFVGDFDCALLEGEAGP